MSYSLLILEDNLQVLSVILKKLDNSAIDIRPTIITDPLIAGALIPSALDKFDLILLDRNSPSGSFHDLDLSGFDPNKIIAISSISLHNQSFTHSVTKNYSDLDSFSESLLAKIKQILRI